MKKADLGFNIFLVIVSIFTFVEGLGYPYIYRRNLGSGFFPVWISVLLFVLALANSIKIMRAMGKETDKPFFINKTHCVRVAIFFVSLLIYILGIVYLGMLLATFLYAIYIYKLFDKFTWKSTLPPAAGLVVFVYVIFNLILGLRMPVGVIWG